jgi:autotransporter translocation and assembly factor TamB
VEGYIDWKDGKFYMPGYGILYDKVRMNAGIKNDSIFIKEFKAEAGAGSLQLSGYSRLDQQNNYAPKVISLRLIGKEFKVIDSDRLQATINTNITLKNEGGNPVFAGDLEVIRSEVNADAFISDYNKASDEADLPMLVKALESESRKKAKSLENDSIHKEMNPKLEFYNNLKGSFNITIPRNLWIRGKDMGIEVKGDLTARKEGANMVLFGTMEVKQGFYRFYGKRFDFKSGKLTLTGDEDINPILEFAVEYSFRDYEKNLKKLQMNITGRLKDPQIAFEMNGSKIDEQDAISYIVFGCSMSELSEGQESTLDISTSTIAKNVAFGQMSSVLQDAVQSSLKLDVVEIAGEDNWDAASVTVGKYINNNLYMSYQYTFALDKKTKIMEPQKISVEYQFFSFLSLKATNQSPNSGLDFIFKKEYK